MSMVSFKKREIVYRPYEAVLKTIVDLVMIICLAFLMVLSFFHKTTIDGNSMSTKLNQKDIVLINKISYSFSSPQRFDIVVFETEDEDGEVTQYVKRIIGLPGETIQIQNGKIYIDGELLEHDVTDVEIYNAGLAADPIKLSYNEYFVLGDNRNNSDDSRFSNIGLVTRSQIIGKPWLCISPISDFGIITDSAVRNATETETETETN